MFMSDLFNPSQPLSQIFISHSLLAYHTWVRKQCTFMANLDGGESRVELAVGSVVPLTYQVIRVVISNVL